MNNLNHKIKVMKTQILNGDYNFTSPTIKNNSGNNSNEGNSDERNVNTDTQSTDDADDWFNESAI